MPLFLTAYAFAILFCVHAFRTGRDRYWLFILLAFPGIGSLIYFIIELLPEIVSGPEAHNLKKWLKNRRFPDTEIAAVRHALETTPTVANRLKMAQLLMGRQDYAGVITVLQPALSGHFADDPAVLEGLAYAYFYQGSHAKALEYAERICTHEAWTPKDYIKLLRAKLLQATGAIEQARTAYDALIKTYAGEEARIAYASFLEARGETAAAQAIYADIVRRAPHAPKHYQKRERDWIEQAQAALKRLPSG